MRFTNQVAIVTGAGSGIGYAIAEQLAQEEASVVLNDLDASLAQSAAQRISPTHCHAHPGDMASLADLEELVDRTLQQFGRIDLLVANAGLTHFADFFATTPEDFQRVIDLNLRGTFFLVQAVARRMKESGRGGQIVLISSIVSLRACPSMAVYAMSKAALNAMATNLVLDLAPLNIRLNTVAVGATLTERTRHEGEDYEQTWDALTPRGRVGQPNDIAQTVLFLLSEESGHIVGQTIVVDGGWTAVGRFPS